VIFPFLDHDWGQHDFLFQDEFPSGELVLGMCSFRVVRPSSLDASGIHCETMYTARPYPLTIWIPIVGLDQRYTLQLAPGSHRATHPPEAVVRNDRFVAQSFSDDYTRRFEYVRPDMRRGQAIILNCNTLHGASHNLGNCTRVSVEVRLREARGASPADARVPLE
jgi:ectoine hydroxylase-related dioxygenase (phytanoyl-CoA dioxygenase family)